MAHQVDQAWRENQAYQVLVVYQVLEERKVILADQASPDNQVQQDKRENGVQWDHQVRSSLLNICVMWA